MGQRVFKIVLIKPSHYDDDGYVIQWWRSFIPSDSLASLYGLVGQCARQRTLGPAVDIAVAVLDETNMVIDVGRLVRAIKSAGSGFVGRMRYLDDALRAEPSEAALRRVVPLARPMPRADGMKARRSGAL